MARSLTTRAAAALVALALFAGCTDDPETTTAGPGAASTDETAEGPGTTGSATTDPEGTAPLGPAEAEAVDAACASLGGTLLRPVGDDHPSNDDALRSAMDVLAADGPEPARSHAEALIALDALDDDETYLSLDEAEIEAISEDGYAGIEGLLEWGIDTCATTEVIWGCVATTGRDTFTSVGEPIGGEDDASATTTTEPGAATPEDVYSEAESDGDPVEISRTDDEVIFAWVDERGLAVESLTVVDDGGWRSDGGEVCDPDALVDEPETGAESLPPPSTSVPGGDVDPQPTPPANEGGPEGGGTVGEPIG